jgi:hypothetical protein
MHRGIRSVEIPIVVFGSVVVFGKSCLYLNLGRGREAKYLL